MKDTKGFPLYVKLGLLGVRSRRAAFAQFWTAVAVSIVLLLVLPGISHSFFWTVFFCCTVLLTAKWYWSSIQWVDAHGRWGGPPAQKGDGADPPGTLPGQE